MVEEVEEAEEVVDEEVVEASEEAEEVVVAEEVVEVAADNSSKICTMFVHLFTCYKLE